MSRPDKPVEKGRPKQSSDVPLSGTSRLDRKSKVPLYVQLGEVLKAELESGAWWPGARFPTERELGDRFAVSRTVIRPALDLLVADGAIIRVRGKGTFVAPPKHAVPLVGLISLLLERPQRIEIEVLSARNELPGPAVADFLELPEGSVRVTRVTAIIHAQGQPVGLIVSHVPIERVPWILRSAEEMRSRNSDTEQFKIELGAVSTSIEGSFLGQWSASQLGVKPGDPAFLGRLVQWGRPEGDPADVPLEFSRLVFRSDNARLTNSEKAAR
jgi:GntR family transcriptional regulator